MMKHSRLWVIAATLTICGMTMGARFSDIKESAVVGIIDDTYTKEEFEQILDDITK